MTTVTSDSFVRAALGQPKGLTELRDSRGELLGYFLPPIPKDELLLYLKVLAEYDPEEIRRQKSEEHGKGKTTAEVLAYLQTLERRPCVTP